MYYAIDSSRKIIHIFNNVSDIINHKGIDYFINGNNTKNTENPNLEDILGIMFYNLPDLKKNINGINVSITISEITYMSILYE